MSTDTTGTAAHLDGDEFRAVMTTVLDDFPHLVGDLTVEDLMALWAEQPETSSLSHLDTIEPGIELAAAVASVDVDELTGHDLVFVLKAHARLSAHHHARLLQTIEAIQGVFDHETPDDLELATETTKSEVRAALRLTRRSADHLCEFSHSLINRLPAVWDALDRGLIDARRAQTICDGVAHVSTEEARVVAGRVLPDAQNLTSGQLAHRLRQLSIDANPEDAARRYADSIEDRRVALECADSGSATIRASDLPAPRARACMNRINRIARGLRRAGDPRSIDQLRSDVLLDLLDGTDDHSGIDGHLEIRVDLETLVELADHPGELVGYGPVIADIARQTARRMKSWNYVITDGGLPIDTGLTRRRPSARVARTVRAFQPTCVFPGCRMPAVDCDLDHIQQYSEHGPTSTENLVPLCRHDHRLRHQTDWSHQRCPDRTEWISPLGHRYITINGPP